MSINKYIYICTCIHILFLTLCTFVLISSYTISMPQDNIQNDGTMGEVMPFIKKNQMIPQLCKIH